MRNCFLLVRDGLVSEKVPGQPDGREYKAGEYFGQVCMHVT